MHLSIVPLKDGEREKKRDLSLFMGLFTPLFFDSIGQS